MRLSGLCGATVRTADGRTLGVVHEVYAEAGRVTELGVGTANLLERLLARRRGKRIAWARVKKIEGGTIIVEE